MTIQQLDGIRSRRRDRRSLGLVASHSRKVRSGAEYDQYFDAPLQTDAELMGPNGTVHDTIKFMRDSINKNYKQTARIAPILRGNTLEDTCRKIFDFTFNHVAYKQDSPEAEQLRTPNRTWADRQSGADCDCYSIFIGSILKNLGIPFAIRMVGINGGDYSHVYIVVPRYGNESDLKMRANYIVIDPVLDTFNEEHSFTKNKDLYMKIQQLSGLGGGVAVREPAVYYSKQAAQIPGDVTFFDGINYYERDDSTTGLHGLDGLHGLGFLKFVGKIGSFVKNSKIVKRIAKPIKKVLNYKKDGTQRKWSAKRDMKKALSTPMQPITPQQSIAPRSVSVMGEQIPLAPMPQAAPMTIPQAMSNPMPDMSSVFNLAKTFMPDNTLLYKLMEAKSESQKGMTSYEAERISEKTGELKRLEMENNMLKMNMENNKGSKTPLYVLGGSIILLGTVAATVAIAKNKNKD